MKQARSLSRRFIGGFLRRTLKNITLFCGFFLEAASGHEHLSRQY
jgi:hypothetical protein